MAIAFYGELTEGAEAQRAGAERLVEVPAVVMHSKWKRLLTCAQ